MFEFRFPSYFIRDPEIIKKLTVKEFESFPEHRNLIPVDSDPIFGKSLFFMTGQDWKGQKNFKSLTLKSNFHFFKPRYAINNVSSIYW